MRTTILGAATAALLSTTALVSAQPTQEPRSNQPATNEEGAKNDRATEPKDKAGDARRTPDAKDKTGDARRTPEAKDKTGDTKRTAEPKDRADDRKRSAEPKSKTDDTKRSAEPKDKTGDSKQSAEPRDKAGDTKRRAEPKDKADDTKRTADPRDKSKDKGDDTKRTADPRDKSDRSKNTAGDRDSSQQRDQAESKDSHRDGARVNLSQDQRTQVRERLSSHREARVTNVNFSINVGTRIPRDFRVHEIPVDIVAIVPHYRGYRYFIVEERVVIVHPSRYEIVEVIEVDGPRRGGPTTATLTLTPAHRELIVRRVPNERISRDVNINLALGAELDRGVELYEFPQDIIVEVPELKSYRYVMLERQIAVVEPSNRTVIEVIDR